MKKATYKSAVGVVMAVLMCISLLPVTALGVEAAPPSSYSAHGHTITVTQLGEQYGYVGPNGAYYSNRYVSEGMVHISPREGGSTGFCDLQGNIVVEPKYVYTGIKFHDGRCPVQVLDEWTGITKFGYLDTSGNMAIEAVYDHAGDFIDGVAQVSQDGKTLCIDTSGAVLGEISYDGSQAVIVDPTGAVPPRPFPTQSPYHDGLKVDVSGGKYGAVDPSGKVVIPYRYDFLSDFSNGLATAKIGPGNDGFGVIDTKGNIIVPLEWSFGAEPFSTDGTVIMIWPGNSNQYILQIAGPQGVVQPTVPEKPSAWAEGAVNGAIAANLVPQTLQEQYTQAATRAEFCALSAALYETATGTEISGRASFSDTTDLNVQKMASLGVVSGVGDGRFDPDGKLTREQAAAMLARLAEALGKPLTAQAPAFADNDAISAWAVDAVGQVQGLGIMGGVGNNAFDPRGEYTREQSILTIHRLFELVK